MFPIRSGLGSATTPDPDQVFFQSLAASAMHEIGRRAIIDASLLMFHQEAADVYYRRDIGTPIAENPDGTYELYSPEEREEIRKHLINVIMKFHIMAENGLGARLTPLIDHLDTKEPLSEESAADAFIQCILAGHQTYSRNLFQGNIQETMAQIVDFDSIQVPDAMILASYIESDDFVDVAIFEDGVVQCSCEFCQRFFDILKIEHEINRDNFNFIQKVMLENYQF